MKRVMNMCVILILGHFRVNFRAHFTQLCQNLGICTKFRPTEVPMGLFVNYVAQREKAREVVNLGVAPVHKD